MIEFIDVEVRYGAKVALRSTSLRFEPGTSVALIGPNGSGKTTILKLLASLITPLKGKIVWDSSPKVAYVAQHQNQHRWMPLTSREVLTTGLYRDLGLLRRPNSAHREAIVAAAERLQVSDALDQPFGQLSGGQKQRLLIATSLLQKSETLLLDEPITGLDLPSQQIILDVMSELKTTGSLVVFSTHHLAEARTADRVLLIDNGIVADGAPGDVLTAANLEQTFKSKLVNVEDGSTAVLDDHGHGSTN